MRHESGTEAQRLAYDTTSAHPAGALPVLSTWEVTSGSGQGNKYTWGGNAWVQTRSGGMALVTTAGAPGILDTRIIRFDNPADMPADITSGANVTADLVQITDISATATRAQFIWHGAGAVGADTQATQAFFGECALGAMIAVGYDDAAAAASALTYVDLTGGGSSASAGLARLMVSKSHAFDEVTFSAGLNRIDLIGVPNGLTSTHLDVFLPCFLEVRIIG